MLVYALALVLLVGVASSDVLTTSGILRGRHINNDEGAIVQYLGVPYAQPPLGNLRFRPPVPLSPSDARRDATFYRPSCIQPPHLQEVQSPLLRCNDTVFSEDCLYLNLYVPRDEKPLPVMVWLSGEGFDFANPQQFDGTYLALLGKVIVVTVSYRVSVFGFLSSLTEDAPGNAGLLDQRMALQWIQDNIKNFGGDPERVTLFGQFTGAMSITAHLSSPLHQKKQLFRRAIIQGGMATGRYIFEQQPLRAVQQLAKLTGCDKEGDIVKCLKKFPAQKLLTASLHTEQRWRPIIDGHLLEKDPMEAFRETGSLNTDILFGTNKDEGSICLLTLYYLNSKAYQDILANKLQEGTLKKLISDNLIDYYKSSLVSLEKVAYDRYRYLHGYENSLRDNYIQFCGDMYIKSSMEEMARITSASNPVYVYQFDHRPSFSIEPTFVSAAKGDDVLFTFGLAYNYQNSTSEEKQLSLRIVDAFASFARTGNPNSEVSSESYHWPIYSPADRVILHFDTDMDKNATARNASDRLVSFWEGVVPYLRKDCSNSHQTSDYYHSSVDDSKLYQVDVKLSIRTVEYLLFVILGVTVFLMLIAVLVTRAACNSKSEIPFRKL